MLVLTRTPGESIMIGDGIELIVLATDGRKVRIGIKAPSDVPVHRTEIYLAIQAQGEVGTDSDPRDLPRIGGRRAS